MIDDQLTKDIETFLFKEQPTDAEIIAGAEILLRINRNRALHQTIVRRPQRMLAKLQYELNKHLRYRKDGRTLQQVRDLQKEVFTEVQKTIDEGMPETDSQETTEDKTQAETSDTKDSQVQAQDKPKTRGKRADHDSLPDDIKNLWTENAERWKKLKKIFETCKTLEQPCDRYEYLLALKEGYEAYKVDMATYDSYEPIAATVSPDSTDSSDSQEMTSEEVVTDNAKTIGNARAYISNGRKKLEKLPATKENAERIADLKAKIQERIDLLVSLGAAIDDETKMTLSKEGFTFN